MLSIKVKNNLWYSRPIPDLIYGILTLLKMHTPAVTFSSRLIFKTVMMLHTDSTVFNSWMSNNIRDLTYILKRNWHKHSTKISEADFPLIIFFKKTNGSKIFLLAERSQILLT